MYVQYCIICMYVLSGLAAFDRWSETVHYRLYTESFTVGVILKPWESTVAAAAAAVFPAQTHAT